MTDLFDLVNGETHYHFDRLIVFSRYGAVIQDLRSLAGGKLWNKFLNRLLRGAVDRRPVMGYERHFITSMVTEFDSQEKMEQDRIRHIFKVAPEMDSKEVVVRVLNNLYGSLLRHGIIRELDVKPFSVALVLSVNEAIDLYIGHSLGNDLGEKVKRVQKRTAEEYDGRYIVTNKPLKEPLPVKDVACDVTSLNFKPYTVRQQYRYADGFDPKAISRIIFAVQRAGMKRIIETLGDEDDSRGFGKSYESLDFQEQRMTALLEAYKGFSFTSWHNDADARLRGIIGDSKRISWQNTKLLRCWLQIPDEQAYDLSTSGEEALALYVWSLVKGSNVTLKGGSTYSVPRHNANRAERIASGLKILKEMDASTICLDHSFSENSDAKKLYKELPERVWLWRILNRYQSPNGTKSWNIPIEVDQTAEVIATTGAVTHWKPFLELTNVIMPEKGVYNDIHSLVYPEDRNISKVVVTPTSYGSSATVKSLIENAVEEDKLDPKYKDDKAFGARVCDTLDIKLITDPRLKFIIAWSDLLVTYGQKEGSSISTDPRHLERDYGFYRLVYQNNKPRKLDEDEAKQPIEGSNHVLKETVTQIRTDDGHGHISFAPATFSEFVGWEMSQSGMDRYWVTGLIHHLGSQTTRCVMDALQRGKEFILNNHDAFMIHPNGATVANEALQKALWGIYINASNILSSYLTSLRGYITTIDQFRTAIEAYHVDLGLFKDDLEEKDFLNGSNLGL